MSFHREASVCEDLLNDWDKFAYSDLYQDLKDAFDKESYLFSFYFNFSLSLTYLFFLLFYKLPLFHFPNIFQSCHSSNLIQINIFYFNPTLPKLQRYKVTKIQSYKVTEQYTQNEYY